MRRAAQILASLATAAALASCTFPSVDYRSTDGGSAGGSGTAGGGGAGMCDLPSNCKNQAKHCRAPLTPEDCARNCVMCATGTCDAALARPPCDQAAGN